LQFGVVAIKLNLKIGDEGHDTASVIHVIELQLVLTFAIYDYEAPIR